MRFLCNFRDGRGGLRLARYANMIVKILFFVLGGLAIGCGGSVSEISTDADSGNADGGGTDGRAADSSAGDSALHEASSDDSATHDGASFACGTAVCPGTDYCVHPCCGGAPPACLPLMDGGTCPTGTSYRASCGLGAPGPGCMPDPCTPPAPYCAPTNDMCGPPAPGTRDVSCACG